MQKSVEEQKAIVRQSTLKMLMDYSRHIDLKLPLSDMVRISETLVYYVMDGRTKDVQRMMEEVDKYIMKKFEGEEGRVY